MGNRCQPPALLYVPDAQGSLHQGSTYCTCTRGRAVRTAYRGTTGGAHAARQATHADASGRPTG